jgi:hypothetical protein
VRATGYPMGDLPRTAVELRHREGAKVVSGKRLGGLHPYVTSGPDPVDHRTARPMDDLDVESTTQWGPSRSPVMEHGPRPQQRRFHHNGLLTLIANRGEVDGHPQIFASSRSIFRAAVAPWVRAGGKPIAKSVPLAWSKNQWA